MSVMIKVGMADLNIAKAPDNITTLGLGSCVGVTLYDPKTKIGGLAHVMLPSSEEIKNNSNKAKFADTALDVLIDKMVSAGANRRNLVAKMAGGAQMFNFNSQNDVLKIGERNAIASKKKLKELGIRILSEDTGGNYGRTIELNTENGDLLIKTIGHGTRVI
jgi:chemotaxis protein CheD